MTLSHIPMQRALLEESERANLACLTQNDFSQGQYYITGRLTQGIFADDCEFTDPTTNVKSPAVYSKAVATLFDKDSSRADLIDIKVRLCPAPDCCLLTARCMLRMLGHSAANNGGRVCSGVTGDRPTHHNEQMAV